MSNSAYLGLCRTNNVRYLQRAEGGVITSCESVGGRWLLGLVSAFRGLRYMMYTGGYGLIPRYSYPEFSIIPLSFARRTMRELRDHNGLRLYCCEGVSRSDLTKGHRSPQSAFIIFTMFLMIANPRPNYAGSVTTQSDLSIVSKRKESILSHQSWMTIAVIASYSQHHGGQLYQPRFEFFDFPKGRFSVDC